MFLLTEIKYRLFRTPGRTILLLLFSAFLVASMGGYWANIKSAENALNELANNIPVTLKVVSRNGNKQDNLCIDTAHFDALTRIGVHNIRATTTYAGAYGREAMPVAPEEFSGGNVSIRGGSDISALKLQDEHIDYLPEYGGDFFPCDNALCLVSEKFAETNGVEPGDTLSVEMYSMLQSDHGVIYTYVDKKEIKVIGLVETVSKKDDSFFDIYVPIDWLRRITTDVGLEFSYGSLSAEIDDPFQLNEAKSELEKNGFLEVFETAGDTVTGDALSVEDETFVKTSVELTKNIETYQAFLLPAFLLIMSIIILVTFLVFRSSRRELAIASSLGRAKIPNAASHFLGAMISELAGCILMTPVICLMFHIGVGLAILLTAIYMLCACIGTIAALALILRFNAMELLTKV